MKQSHRLPIPEEEQVQPKSQPHVQVLGEKAWEPWDTAGVLISSLNLRHSKEDHGKAHCKNNGGWKKF